MLARSKTREPRSHFTITAVLRGLAPHGEILFGRPESLNCGAHVMFKKVHTFVLACIQARYR